MSIAKPISGNNSGILRANHVRFAGRFLAVVLAALHTWAAISAHSMNADGIVYLDLGDAFWRGDWGTAVNAVWSPLYAWTVGLALRLFNPAMAWEFTLVHLVDFVIYLGALLCFEQLWRQLWLYQEEEQQHDGRISLPEWAWLAIGYTLFIWVSMSLIEIWAVTPDMLMACFVYLAAAQLVRLRRGADRWRDFAWLGLWSGLGYLSKAVMFPLAFVFLFAALFSLGDVRRAWPKVLLSLLLFLLISGPWIALISASRGRFTFSDASTITYLRYVQGLPFVHWQGEDPPVNGTPLHPTRQVLAAPPVYEFATPVGGTYPAATDPVYWYEGAETRLNVTAQLRLLLASGLFYLDLFARQQAVLVTAVLLAWWLGWQRPSASLTLLRRYGLTLIALAAFTLYALVLVEGRYVGVFVILFWGDLLANWRLPDSPPNRRLAPALSLIAVAVMWLNIFAFNLDGFVTVTGGATTAVSADNAPPPTWPGETAVALHELGLQPGDHVGIIGYGFDAFWARLARVKIVAEMPPEAADAFWLAGDEVQEQVLAAFAYSGAQAIVAEYVPAYADTSGWQPVGNSSYYIYLLASD
ncbi:MAG: hypothetical protein IAE79_14155 [Anaerolinea sp.]|nr:hypothetical protein [Anaerolinea sp.]